MAQRKYNVVPDGAVTGSVIEVPGSIQSVSRRPSIPGPVPAASMNNAPDGWLVNWEKISSQTVPGEPQLKTSPSVDGTSFASTMLSVCGSSVLSLCSSVSDSPLAIEMCPGVNFNVDWIFALGTK